MSLQNAEVYGREDGHILMRVHLAGGSWAERDLTAYANGDLFGIDALWVDWARQEISRQKGVRKKRCGTCGVWWEMTPAGASSPVGECRKTRPIIVIDKREDTTTVRTHECPVTDHDFRCGEWESRNG